MKLLTASHHLRGGTSAGHFRSESHHLGFPFRLQIRVGYCVSADSDLRFGRVAPAVLWTRFPLRMPIR
eukprot:753752-Lingulodinium_polyedra.AAC.1